MPEYCDVAFNLPLAQTFVYACADAPGCAVGKRVRAPFKGRSLVGFVVAVRETKPEGGFTIRPIDRVVDDEPVFGELTLALAAWLSGLYLLQPGRGPRPHGPGREAGNGDRGGDHLP